MVLLVYGWRYESLFVIQARKRWPEVLDKDWFNGWLGGFCYCKNWGQSNNRFVSMFCIRYVGLPKNDEMSYVCFLVVFSNSSFLSTSSNNSILKQHSGRSISSSDGRGRSLLVCQYIIKSNFLLHLSLSVWKILNRKVIAIYWYNIVDSFGIMYFLNGKFRCILEINK